MADNKAASRVFLLVSVILGVLATVLAFVYLNQGDRDSGPKVSILIASHDLPVNTALDPDKDLTEMTISVSQNMADFRSRTYGPEYKSTLKGQRINRFILANQPIFQSDVAATGELKIRDGYRAMSIAVRGANALPGLLNPDDYVKLMVTRPAGRIGAPGSNAGDAGMIWQSAEIVNTPLRVLAVGGRTRRAITEAEQYQEVSHSDASSVTLEVTEQEAKSILEATGAGQLTVTLVLVPVVAETQK